MVSLQYVSLDGLHNYISVRKSYHSGYIEMVSHQYVSLGGLQNYSSVRKSYHRGYIEMVYPNMYFYMSFKIRFH